MGDELQTLRAVTATMQGLAKYSGEDAILTFALEYAISEINKRRGYTGEGYEAKYRQNVITGAMWRLSNLGAEGVSSYTELGVTVSKADVPEWLQSVVPLLQTGTVY